jgi:hypothetical protein
MRHFLIAGAVGWTLVVVPGVSAEGTKSRPTTALVSGTATTKSTGMTRPGTIRLLAALQLSSQRGSGVVDMSDAIRAQGAPASVAKLFVGVYVALGPKDIYMSLPAFGLFPGTKKWLHTTNGFAGANGGGGTDLASDNTSPDLPFGELAAFRRAGATVTTLGKVTLRGVATTHYKVTIGIVPAVSAFAPAKDRGRAIVAAHKLVRLSHHSSETCELWVDSDGTTRRERCTVVQSVNDQPLKFGPETDTSDIIKFGVPVSVHIPPASQVMTEAQWEKATSQSSGGTTTTT